MAPFPRRRLTLLDAMILIVALAAVLPASRQVLARTFWYEPLFDDYGGDRVQVGGLGQVVWHDVRSIALGLSPCLASLTIALTALQWRRPRVAWRLLPRSPGLVACGVASLVLVTEAALGWEDEGVRYLMDFPVWWLPFSTRNAGGAVAGAWLALAGSGRWRRERGNLDRAGVLLGACWITSYLLTFHDYERF